MYSIHLNLFIIMHPELGICSKHENNFEIVITKVLSYHQQYECYCYLNNTTITYYKYGNDVIRHFKSY